MAVVLPIAEVVLGVPFRVAVAEDERCSALMPEVRRDVKHALGERVYAIAELVRGIERWLELCVEAAVTKRDVLGCGCQV